MISNEARNLYPLLIDFDLSVDLDRRINVLIYLNHNWKESYGGSLELWDRKVKKCVKKIFVILTL